MALDFDGLMAMRGVLSSAGEAQTGATASRASKSAGALPGGDRWRVGDGGADGPAGARVVQPGGCEWQ